MFIRPHPKTKDYLPLINYLGKFKLILDKSYILDPNKYDKFCVINSNLGLELISKRHDVDVYGSACYKNFNYRDACNFINFLKENSF